MLHVFKTISAAPHCRAPLRLPLPPSSAYVNTPCSVAAEQLATAAVHAARPHHERRAGHARRRAPKHTTAAVQEGGAHPRTAALGSLGSHLAPARGGARARGGALWKEVELWRSDFGAMGRGLTSRLAPSKLPRAVSSLHFRVLVQYPCARGSGPSASLPPLRPPQGTVRTTAIRSTSSARASSTIRAWRPPRSAGPPPEHSLA